MPEPGNSQTLPSGAQKLHESGFPRRNDSASISAILSAATAVSPAGSEPLASGTAPLMSVGVPPPQAASNRLAAISLSTKPFRLTLALIFLIRSVGLSDRMGLAGCPPSSTTGMEATGGPEGLISPGTRSRGAA
jgi:hypothetical protein